MQRLFLYRSNHFYHGICYGFTALIIAVCFFCSAKPTRAQGLAYLQRGGGIVYNQMNGNEHKKISLRRVLSDIGRIYDVQFAINDRLVKDRYLNKDSIKYESIGKTLKTILTPFHLKYNYVDGYYGK